MDIENIVDRLDRMSDRLDRVVDRLDRIVDRQNIHTQLLREIKMTQADNSQDVQALVSAVQDLSNEVTDGLGAVDSRFTELQNTINSLTSLNDQERQALQDATASVRSQIGTVAQSFSRFKQNPDTPVDPTPVPDPSEGNNPTPSPEPTPTPVDGGDPVPNPEPGPVGPVSRGDAASPENGGLNFGG